MICRSQAAKKIVPRHEAPKVKVNRRHETLHMLILNARIGTNEHGILIAELVDEVLQRAAPAGHIALPSTQQQAWPDLERRSAAEQSATVEHRLLDIENIV